MKSCLICEACEKPIDSINKWYLTLTSLFGDEDQEREFLGAHIANTFQQDIHFHDVCCLRDWSRNKCSSIT